MMSAIFSIVAIIFLLFTDFAGFYYYSIDNSYYSFLFSDTKSTILILSVIAGFGSIVFILSGPLRTRESLSKENLDLCFKISIGILVVVLIGVLFYIIESFEATDDWLDSAFYGSFIGSIINIFIFYNLKQQSK